MQPGGAEPASLTAQESSAARTAAGAVAEPAPRGTAATLRASAYQANAAQTQTAFREAPDSSAMQAMFVHGNLQLAYQNLSLALKKHIGCMMTLQPETLI